VRPDPLSTRSEPQVVGLASEPALATFQSGGHHRRRPAMSLHLKTFNNYSVDESNQLHNERFFVNSAGHF
jgi:hypothetical protein